MFAFGALLYEMLTGARAFRGDTAADTMTAILTKDPPDLDTAGSSIPAGLDRIVRRCLEKSPDLRFQSANDLAFALEAFSGASTSSPATSSAAAHAISPRRPLPAWLPWTVAVVAVLVAAAAWLTKGGGGPVEPRFASFTRISELAGEETAPSLSPDGSTVAYAIRTNGSWDIYTQRVGGRNATPIINDPQRDEGGPAFSPDGASIAFHEMDADGGIFVAGATGESARRLTETGFHPAWSPDGTQIAFNTEEIRDPASRLGDSTVYVIAAAGGTPRKIVDGDGAQPSWSPSGDRIVYWSNTGGQRDIYTVSTTGGPRVAVTSDPAIDWCPVWSPDGRHIYFASDRGGAMNMWRIALDLRSGQPLSPPEPVTTGVQASAALPSFSKDGSRLAFRSRVGSVNPVEIPFNPATGRAGEPRLLDTRNNIRIPSDVSADGRQIAFFSIGERQEDLFVGSADGSMRRVTDDAGRDRAPVFMPDGRSLLFYSNRDGQWDPWMVGVDGGNLRKVMSTPAGSVYVLRSPRGDTMVFSGQNGRDVYTAPIAPGGQATKVPGTEIEGGSLNPSSWSPDGHRWTGAVASPSGRPIGVGVYDLETRAASMVSRDETYGVQWLPDSRRIVYFTKGGWDLVMVDTRTKVRTPVAVRVPAPATMDVFAIRPDGRAIYYGASRAEADIWIVEKK